MNYARPVASLLKYNYDIVTQCGGEISLHRIFLTLGPTDLK